MKQCKYFILKVELTIEDVTMMSCSWSANDWLEQQNLLSYPIKVMQGEGRSSGWSQLEVMVVGIDDVFSWKPILSVPMWGKGY